MSANLCAYVKRVYDPSPEDDANDLDIIGTEINNKLKNMKWRINITSPRETIKSLWFTGKTVGLRTARAQESSALINVTLKSPTPM